jgi:hypothetical protein
MMTSSRNQKLKTNGSVLSESEAGDRISLVPYL